VKRYKIKVAPEARADLSALYRWISSATDNRRAMAYLKRLKKFLQSFNDVPFRGSDRSDLRKGMRTIGFEGRLTIVFMNAVL
jgi:toxin ParE1/3/4